MKKNYRVIYILLLDILLVHISFALTLYLRYDIIPLNYYGFYLSNFLALALIKLFIYNLFGLYKSLWKYASIEELSQVIISCILSNILVFGFLYIRNSDLTKGMLINIIILDILLIGGSRFSYRLIRKIKISYMSKTRVQRRIMVIGGGDAGAYIVNELKNYSSIPHTPVVIIDDDSAKIGKRIHGVPVLGTTEDIEIIAKEMNIDEIIIAIPSASRERISDIIKICKKTKCKLKRLPNLFAIMNQGISLDSVVDVQIEDLLGRDEVNLNIDEIKGYLKDRVILVTGGGGSIGSELCRQISMFDPKKLIVLEINENNAFNIRNEILQENKDINLKIVIASIRDKYRIREVFKKLRPDVVFHAAAHKHVPLMEENPKEAVKNNIIGTLNLAEAADEFNVNKFVLISTDKAVNPTNIMGATKRVCELLIQSLNEKSKTSFTAVRFGNVLGSSGSVIPLFKEQIKKGGPVTVTHEKITRFFMTIPEASQLVIQAGALSTGGEIFVLDMGEPVKILDLAEDLISLSGFIPYEEITIKIIGLRPGDKLYEELYLEEEIQSTEHEKIFVGKSRVLDYEELVTDIREMKENLDKYDDGIVYKFLKKIVPSYNKLS